MSINWSQFSENGIRSIAESDARLDIWEGAVRSTKTVCSTIRWIEYTQTGPQGPLLMAGKTERTLYRNILRPIEEIVGQANFKYNRGTGELRIRDRVIDVVGANDEKAQDKIKGGTYAGAYQDEVTTSPESFFTMLLSRLSIPGASYFGTTNPDSPYHWLKKKYLDRKDELNLKTWHFTLDDNLSLSKDYVDALKREYVGLWYKRYIQGLWVAAEGAIYDMMADGACIVDNLPLMTKTWIGVDYGTTNPTVFVELGLGVDDCLYVIREWRWDSLEKLRQLTDSEYSSRLREWVGNSIPRWVFVDPSAASFKVQLFRDGVRNVADADNAVLDGIRRVSSLLTAGKLKIHRSCVAGIEEMVGYAWDTKKSQESGEDAPLKVADHFPDALRYVINGTRLLWEPWLSMRRR